MRSWRGCSLGSARRPTRSFDASPKVSAGIDTACSGEGTCRLCHVRIIAGAEHRTSYCDEERKHLGNRYHITRVRASLTVRFAFSLLHVYLRDILWPVLDRFVAVPFNPPPIAAILEIPEQDRAASASASFVEGFEKTADYVADAIVEGGVSAVDDTIDRLLDDDHYEELHQQLVASVPWSVASRVQQSPADASQLEVPALVRDRVALALRLEYEVFRAQWRLIALSRLEGTEPARPATTETLFNVPLPYQLRAAAIAHRIGEVCGMALSSGKVASSNELAVVLVEKWIHGARANLGIWAALLRSVDPRVPEIDVQILPRSYIVDLERVHDEYLEAQRGLAIALDEVERTGSGFPVQES